MRRGNRNTDYATPIWRCETKWDMAKKYVGWTCMWAILLFSLYAVAVCFNEVVL